MISCYGLFIPNCSDLTAPLTDLLKKDVKEPIQWTPAAQSAFETLKSCLMNNPILKLPNPTVTFALRTAASSVGLGAVQLQYHDDIPFRVRYASRKLSKPEQNYSTIERECLAIVHGVEKFRHYLTGKEFYIEVDHKPLLYISKMKATNSRLMRWAILLQAYRFRLVYIPGSYNVGADFLSRLG